MRKMSKEKRAKVKNTPSETVLEDHQLNRNIVMIRCCLSDTISNDIKKLKELQKYIECLYLIPVIINKRPRKDKRK